MDNIGSTGKHWKLSKETKDKMSEARKGTHPSKESILKMTATKTEKGQYSGINNSFYGKKHTEESKLEMSQTHKDSFANGREAPTGMLGHNHTEQFKLDQSIRLTGLHRTEEQKENYRQSKLGHIVTEETREKIRQARKGKYCKENHPNWRGGSKPYPIEFNYQLKELVRERDGYICQLCHCEQGKIKLDVHHIDYQKWNLDFKNLISLCISCHRKTGANREYYTNYFSLLLHK